jgi:peptidoglycan/xylan/chitin deacetylase (PgdA/CDA1 family)
MLAADRTGPRASREAALVLTALVGVHLAGGAPAGAADHAVVLVYHHVSDRTPASTSVTPEVFERHLEHLAAHDFTVLALPELLRSLAEGRPLPPRAVALTFDDGYASVYHQALPRLERRGWPFAVFVAPESLGNGSSLYMSWDELRDLERRGGLVGNHSLRHDHLVRRRPGEAEAEWRRRVRDDILQAQSRLEVELEHPLEILAYPYGEFDAPLEAIVRELGFVGLGQQSGPVGRDTSWRGVPRFPVATGFDDLDSLGEKLRSRPLPVTVLAPDRRILEAGAGAPELRLRIPEGPYRRADLRCYVSGQPPARIGWQGKVAVIQARRSLGPGRHKYNCTAPSREEAGVFYWYTHLWIQPNDDGSWYSG